MADRFDAYYKWLGIPSAEQPPHHYRLLGIALFEADRDVIESAADQRMSHLRSFQAGEYSALSQKLLNEVAAAKRCLLTPEKKARYDAALKRRVRSIADSRTKGENIGAAAPGVAVNCSMSVDVDLGGRSGISVGGASKRKPGPRRPAILVCLAAALSLIAALAAYSLSPSAGENGENRPQIAATATEANSRPQLDAKTPDAPSANAGPQPTPQEPTGGVTPVVSPTILARFPCDIPEPSCAQWWIDGDELVQSSLEPCVNLFFGDPNWTDYDFSAEIKLVDGSDHGGLLFRQTDGRNTYLFFVGGFNNQWQMVESVEDGKNVFPQPARRPAAIARGQWYLAEAKLRGERGECFLDGEKVLEFKADKHRRGRVGLRTWLTSYRFRNIVVKDPQGTILLAGLPDVSTEPPALAQNSQRPSSPLASVESDEGKTSPDKKPEPAAAEAPPSPPLAVAPFDAKQARAHQEAWAAHLKVPVEQKNPSGIRLALIPPGEFTMGATPEQIAITRKLLESLKIKINDEIEFRLREEAACRRITLSKPFLAGCTEVTIGQFRRFVEATGYKTDAERFRCGQSVATTIPSDGSPDKNDMNWRAPGYAIGEHTAVSQVTWGDAAEFCNWLSDQEKLPPCYRNDGNGNWSLVPSADGYRLLTEAEWEYCCRGGTETQFFFGDDPAQLKEFAWCNQNAGSGVMPAGMKQPNPFGLLDLYGNVFEWCHDRYRGEYDANASRTDPTGPPEGSVRVIRGGCWLSDPFRCRSALRHEGDPMLRSNLFGFRVMRVSTNPVPGSSSPASAEVANNLEESKDHGFVPLFNGKDLTGWKTNPASPGNWRVEGGILIGSGPAVSYLYSDREDFRDFHLRAEARVSAGGNCGIFFRESVGPQVAKWPRGYEAEISGAPERAVKTGGLLVGEKFTTNGPAANPDGWFVMEIITEANHIVIKVNGAPATDYVDDQRSFASGRIALQQFKDYSRIEFRRIEIKELRKAGTSVASRENKPADKHSSKEQPVGAPSAAGDKPAGKVTAKELFSLKQHTAGVTRVAFHPTTPLLASSGKDGRVLLWNLNQKAVQAEFGKFENEVWALKFSPNGDHLAFGNRDWWGSSVSFKVVGTAIEVQKLKDFKKSGGGSVESMAFSPDGQLFAVGQGDGSVRLWETSLFAEAAPVSFGSKPFNLAFGPLTVDRKRKRTDYVLAVGCEDGLVRTIAVTFAKGRNGIQTTFQPTDVQFPKQRAVTGLRFSPDGKLLGAARHGGQISLYDPATGKSVRELTAGGDDVAWLSFHPERPWCVTAHMSDRVARLWNSETAELLTELKGHNGGVLCAEFSRDGRHIATASEDMSIKIWELASPELPALPARPRKAKPAPLIVGE